jgi:hypothetical protein
MSVELVDTKHADAHAGARAGARAGGLEADTVRGAQVNRVEGDRSDAMIDEWGRQSFPASDPPSNW